MNFNRSKEVPLSDKKSELVVSAMFAKNLIKDNQISGVGLFDTKENVEALKGAILSLKSKFIPGFDVDNVITELRKQGLLLPPVVEKKLTPEVAPIVHETEYVKIAGTKAIEVDEEEKKIIDANLIATILHKIEKENIFHSDAELESIYNKVTTLSQERIKEDPAYYYAFAEAGLLEGGVEEVKKDLADLAQRKQDFVDKQPADPKAKANLEKVKKIATITEKGLAYIVSELALCGENISIENANEFNDVKRGIDDVMQIKKENNESAFLGLGIDVTFSQEKFEEKYDKLLLSIKSGHKTKLKYFKNHDGEMMKEFAVPKIIMPFSMEEVKEIVHIIKDMDKETVKENPMKAVILQKVVTSCEKLAIYAEAHGNEISQKYREVIEALGA